MKKIMDFAEKLLLVTTGGIMVVAILIWMALLIFPAVSSYLWKKESGYQSIRENPYECGRFGDKLMRIDRRYLAFARVTYDGVDYWGPGYTKDHFSKGCDDQILSAEFEVQWPQMTPIPSGRWEDVDFVSISLNQRSEWPVKNHTEESKDFFDATRLLLNYLSHTDTFDRDKDISIDEINESKTFNVDLGLYEMMAYDNERSKTVAFWQEVEGKGVSPVIKCIYFKESWSRCDYDVHVPGYGYHTSYLKISFHADLIFHWKEIHRDTMQLVESFTVDGDMQ